MVYDIKSQQFNLKNVDIEFTIYILHCNTYLMMSLAEIGRKYYSYYYLKIHESKFLYFYIYNDNSS